MDTIFIDGSAGEGGGQILRTSLTLSCITGRSLHIENIRAARRNPGLANQHLSCVRAACQICKGQSQGATKGSKVLDFQPGSHSWSVNRPSVTSHNGACNWPGLNFRRPRPPSRFLPTDWVINPKPLFAGPSNGSSVCHPEVFARDPHYNSQ